MKKTISKNIYGFMFIASFALAITVGGLAPRTIPDGAQVGQLDSIPYQASYLFYTKN